MKYTLFLNQNLPFGNYPVSCELSPEHILCNDVCLPRNIDEDSGRYNPHNIKMWVIGNEFGALCACFASYEQEAFDTACDAGLLDGMMCENQEHDHPDNECMDSLGNAGELFDLTYAWIGEVSFDAARDIKLICKLVRASEGGHDTLDF